MPSANNSLIAKNTIILAFQQVFSLVVSLYSSRIILQALGVEDFGIYNVVGGFVSMFAFLNTSMSNATQRFYNFEFGKNGEIGALKVFNTALIIQIVLSIVLVVLLESIGLWYMYEKLVVPESRFNAAFWIFQFSTLSLVFVVMQIPLEAAILAHEKMSCLAIVSILDTTLKLIIAISIKYISGDKLIWYGLFFFLISVLNLVFYYCYSKKHFSEIRIVKIRDKSLFKKMLSFSGWNLFGSFSGVAKEQGINMILNLFFGPIVNAARGIAYQVAGALKSFTTNVTISSRPQLVQSYAQNDIRRTIQIMFSMSKFSYLIVLLFAIPVMFEIDYILDIWLSTSIPTYTGLFVNLVIVIAIIESLNPPISFVVHATGQMSRYQLITSIISVLIIPIAYVLLKLDFPPESVFYLGIVIQIIVQLVCMIILKSLVEYSLRDYVVMVLVPLTLVSLFTIVPSGVVHYIMDGGFIRLLCVTLVSTVSLIGSTLIVALNSGEKEMIYSLIHKIIKK